MLSKWIILFFIGSLPFGQDVIGEGLYDQELIDFLKENYKTSTTLSYNSARDVMYLEIDRKDDGSVFGIYTNYSVLLPESGVDPSTHLYENGIDCEHIWPQSMYEGTNPMKSDMHHLRPSKSNVNSSRGNKPFGENPDSVTHSWYWMSQNQSSIPSNNIDKYSESASAYFEPREDRKGDIARSMFYFYTMYSEVTDDDFFEGQKEILKIWHDQDPTNEDEITRTWQIAEYQDNKPNPFILDATLVERAYFYDGILVGDLNADGILNVLDILVLVNIIMGNNDDISTADINEDGSYNVLDVLMLANIIISQN